MSEPLFPVFRTITCPNCKTELPQYEHRSIYVSCHNCGVFSDATAERPYTVIRQFDPDEVPQPGHTLSLGTQLGVEDEVWLLLGRRHFFWHYSESENGAAPEEQEMVKDYAHDTSFFEWLAIDRRAERRYIREYEGHFALVYPTENALAAVPTEKYILDFETGEPRLIETRGVLEVGYFVGETRFAFEHLAEAWEQVAYTTADATYWLKYRQGFDLNAFEHVESLREIQISTEALNQAKQKALSDDLPELVEATEEPHVKGFFRRLFGG